MFIFRLRLPARAHRGAKHIPHKHEKYETVGNEDNGQERLVKILIAACSQSGRKFLPSLDETKDFLIGIKDWKKSGGAGFIMTAAALPLKIGGNFQRIITSAVLRYEIIFCKACPVCQCLQ